MRIMIIKKCINKSLDYMFKYQTIAGQIQKTRKAMFGWLGWKYKKKEKKKSIFYDHPSMMIKKRIRWRRKPHHTA